MCIRDRYNSGDPANGTNPAKTGLIGIVCPSASPYDNKSCWFNFGQDDTFGGSETSQGNTDGNGIGVFQYAPPSGFLTLCSKNLPEPSILLPDKHFETRLYSGSQSGQSGFEFAPDWVWIKGRNFAVYNNLFDTVRGASKVLVSNISDEESTNSTLLNGFTSDGYTFGSNTDVQGGGNYVSWNWKALDHDRNLATINNDGSITSSVSANQEAGFSIVVYTGNGSAGGGGTIGHGLGKIPNIMWVKNRADASNWSVNGNAGGRLIYGTNKIYLHSGSGLPADTNEVTAATATTFTVTTLSLIHI